MLAKVTNQREREKFKDIGGETSVLTSSPDYAIKITVVGDVTYVGLAAPGTVQATAKWQCKKIDEATGTVITWADGDADFDNIATDLTSLDYS